MLPTFVIIGAMKCGTTSLHHYLAEHPEVCMPSIKETNFFVEQLNYGRGLAWYQSLFSREAKACGEASPAYSSTRIYAGIPERMHALLPQARLIYMVRDPIDRMVSQYKHAFACGLEHRTLNATLEAELDERGQRRYLKTSQYYQNLLPYLDRYPLERILVLPAEDLHQERQTTLRRVFEFIGVDPDFESPAFERLWHPSDAKFTRRKNVFNMLLPRGLLNRLKRWKWNPAFRPLPPPQSQLDPALKSRIIHRLAPETDQFRRLTGQAFPGWCV